MKRTATLASLAVLALALCWAARPAPAVQGCDWMLRSGPGGPNVAICTFANVRVEGDCRVQVGAARAVYLTAVQMSQPWGEYQEDVDATSTLAVRDSLIQK